MTFTNITCIICQERYEKTDSIHITNCGHLFHDCCLAKWLTCSHNCPQCRKEYPTRSKVFLNFEDVILDEEKMEDIGEMMEVLKQKTLCLNKLKKIIEEKSRKIFDLEIQLELCEKEFMLLQKQFTEKDQNLKNMSFENDILKSKVNSGKQEMKTFYLERNQMQFLLNSKIKYLEEKIASTPTTSKIQNTVKLSVKKSTVQTNKQDQIKELPKISERNLEKLNDDIAKKSRRKRITNKNKNAVNDVVVKGFSQDDIKQPKEDLVLKLIQQMEIKCTLEDIEQISIMNQKSNKQNTNKTVSILIKFKSPSMKNQFLTNKPKLKNNSDTKHLQVNNVPKYELNHALFIYAKNLKAFGYAAVYIKKGSIFATETNHSKPIKILKTEQVDQMLENKRNKN